MNLKHTMYTPPLIYQSENKCAATVEDISRA